MSDRRYYTVLFVGLALASGCDAVAFLATQGDVWDTQWDMLLAMLGAIAAQLLLAGWHGRSMRRLELR